MIKAEEQDNSHIGAAGHDDVDEEQETTVLAHLNLTDGWELMAEMEKERDHLWENWLGPLVHQFQKPKFQNPKP